MKKILFMLIFCLSAIQAQATDIDAQKLQLSAEQNQKLTELKANLKAEIEPIWQEIEEHRQKIMEIEKKYFAEFWQMLTEQQRAEFAAINQQQ